MAAVGESRRTMRNGAMFAGIILAVVVIAAAAAVVMPFGSSRSHSFSPNADVAVVAEMVYPNGTYATEGTLRMGQELLLSVAVPDTTSPVAVHQVFDGHVYATFEWNVSSTRYNYVIDSAPADEADLGTNVVYAVVTFADGTNVTSNVVIMKVTP